MRCFEVFLLPFLAFVQKCTARILIPGILCPLFWVSVPPRPENTHRNTVFLQCFSSESTIPAERVFFTILWFLFFFSSNCCCCSELFHCVFLFRFISFFFVSVCFTVFEVCDNDKMNNNKNNTNNNNNNTRTTTTTITI